MNKANCKEKIINDSVFGIFRTYKEYSNNLNDNPLNN
jgi:hypothetical protein